ncbi:MAG TPA: GNAT family N-acetyltransferase [Casimicrobiaceae bacterium]|jgi:ribosomal protein S18 acetylase RimI-like enzyme
MSRRNASVGHAQARRLEEMALNASGAFRALLYDGWLLGFEPGPTKRLRCVNPTHRSTLPLEQKLDYCIDFYRAAGLPAIFRMLPFARPAVLDSYLAGLGWTEFERTLVMRADLAEANGTAAHAETVELVAVTAWVEAARSLLGVTSESLPRLLERAASYPLPQTGALIRRDGAVVACGLAKIEEDHVGLFALHTAPALRGRGLGRAVVAALLGNARERGKRIAYLQVTAHNAPAVALYRRFGFASVYDYWYRARPDEQH